MACRNLFLSRLCLISVALMAHLMPSYNLPPGAQLVLDSQGATITGTAPDCHSASWGNTCDAYLECPWSDGPLYEEPPTAYGFTLHIVLCEGGGQVCGGIYAWQNCP